MTLSNVCLHVENIPAYSHLILRIFWWLLVFPDFGFYQLARRSRRCPSRSLGPRARVRAPLKSGVQQIKSPTNETFVLNQSWITNIIDKPAIALYGTLYEIRYESQIWSTFSWKAVTQGPSTQLGREREHLLLSILLPQYNQLSLVSPTVIITAGGQRTDKRSFLVVLEDSIGCLLWVWCFVSHALVD